jgi:two-component system chemotaxis sensor kinase CheA
MTDAKDDFFKKLLATFKLEAEEHLSAITAGLLELEKQGDVQAQGEIIETMLREAHSLKGAARAVTLTKVERICQSLESVFSALKKEKIEAAPTMFDTLHRTVDFLSGIIELPDTESRAVSEDQVENIVGQLTRIESGELESPRDIRAEEDITEEHTGETATESENLESMETITSEPESPQPQPYSGNDRPEFQKKSLSGNVRVPMEKLDALLLQAEDMLSVKHAVSQRVQDITDTLGAVKAWRNSWAKLHPDIRDIAKILDAEGVSGGDVFSRARMGKLLELSDATSARLTSIETRINGLRMSFISDLHALESMLGVLLDDVKEMLMLPFSMILEVFPKFVRDLSRDQGKEAVLSVKGGEIHVDRRILEEIRDPLMHLVRNCIDHGIEATDERLNHDKPKSGTVTIEVSRETAAKVKLVISDDGRGIDAEKLKAATIKRGIMSEADVKKLTEHEVLSLAFESGISTSSIITDISGRGLGLAIVKEKAEKIGGSISVVSNRFHGTSFSITFPAMLATHKGILVRVEEEEFIIPTAHVERIVRIHRDEIKSVENRTAFSIDGHMVPCVRLGDILDVPPKEKDEEEYIQTVILGAGEEGIGFEVDCVEHVEEFLVKELSKNLSRVKNISGATILGTGKVVPILNAVDLVKSAMGAPTASIKATVSVKGEEEKRSLLVVEDSITSRMLLKNILEAAGYTVKTAVDGIDGFTTLKEGRYDLVVSDVDMPRLNGFGLTAKIRADKKLSNLPVVLVTALGSREDRERGIDVGADAYIVKSSFDQTGLLDIIRRLI